ALANARMGDNLNSPLAKAAALVAVLAATAVAVGAGSGVISLRMDSRLLPGGHWLFSAGFAPLAIWLMLRGRSHPDWDPLEPGRLFSFVWCVTLAICFLRLSVFEAPFT